MLIYTKIINKINSEKYDIGLNKKQTNKISSIELDQFDLKMLELMEIVLGPIAQATNMISGSQYPTVGIAYFATIQIREFLEDFNDIGLYDTKIFIHLKEILLKQVEKYFVGKDEQWDMMKVRLLVLIYSMKNLSFIKTFAYFDPIGYGCLTRRERRAIEANIMDIQEQRVNQEIDEEEPNASESTSNKKQKAKKSSTSSMAKFLTSLGKKKYLHRSILKQPTKTNSMKK
jgi:hypothetical protein